jgi:D-arabinose 1-dehydrogenase-like Zn-dependent alcohol dehydrogenase
VWATGRTEAKQAVALSFGAHAAFPSGARLPERVDAVLETVGEATWSHSLRAVKPGGRIVLSGATSGRTASTDLSRVYFLQLSIVGSTMGTRGEFADMMAFMRETGVRPHIDRVLPLSAATDGFAAMEAGNHVGKIVLEP